MSPIPIEKLWNFYTKSSLILIKEVSFGCYTVTLRANKTTNFTVLVFMLLWHAELKGHKYPHQQCCERMIWFVKIMNYEFKFIYYRILFLKIDNNIFLYVYTSILYVYTYNNVFFLRMWSPTLHIKKKKQLQEQCRMTLLLIC